MFSKLKEIKPGIQYGFFGNNYSQIDEVLLSDDNGKFIIAKCSSVHGTQAFTKYVFFLKENDNNYCIEAESISYDGVLKVFENVSIRG